MKKARTVVTAAAAVAVAVPLMSPSAAAAPVPTAQPPARATEQRPVLVQAEFIRPVSVESIVQAVDRGGLVMHEVRLHGSATAVLYTKGVPVDRVAGGYRNLIEQGSRKKVPPVVTGIAVEPVGRLAAGDPAKELTGLGLPVQQVTVRAEPAEWVTPGLPSPSTSARTSSRSAAPPAAAVNTGYAFPRVEVAFGEGQARTVEYRMHPAHTAKVNGQDTVFSWDRNRFDDFGYEADFKQYNTTDNLRGIRPVCLNLDNDQLFWAARGSDSEIAGYFTNIRTDARPYFDGNDALDDCSNSTCRWASASRRRSARRIGACRRTTSSSPRTGGRRART